MSAPSVIIFGFGLPGSLLEKSLTSGTARYVQLPGEFTDLATPQPALWKLVAETIRDENETLIVWASDALILWDRLDRAMAVNHQPDFLWPLSLALQDGAVVPDETDLFLAVGGFEISLFPFKALGGFHHAVRARALAKLLAVSDMDTLTIGDYLQTAWLNFESVKAPDSWLVRGDKDTLLFNAQTDQVLDKATAEFAHHHRQWQMGRVALEAQSRNMLAAAEFARANLDVMQPRMEKLMARLPYHGFWPVKAGRAGALTLPSFGYHPVVASLIWRGSYFDKARDVWNALFCQGAYTQVLDLRGDGHLFGLLLSLQQQNTTVLCHPTSVQNTSLAQAAIEANRLNAIVSFDTPKAIPGGVAVLSAHAIPDALWGTMDLYIPLNGETITGRTLPTGYQAFMCEVHQLNLIPVADLNDVRTAAAFMLIHDSRAKKIITGGRA